MDVADFGALYKRHVPTICRWCNEPVVTIPTEDVDGKQSFAVGCNVCDQMFQWPRIIDDR